MTEDIRAHAQRVAGCTDIVDEAACLIFAELCPGVVMLEEDRPRYENAARAVLRLQQSGVWAPADDDCTCGGGDISGHDALCPDRRTPAASDGPSDLAALVNKLWSQFYDKRPAGDPKDTYREIIAEVKQLVSQVERSKEYADVALGNAAECSRLELENTLLRNVHKAASVYYGSYVQDEAEEIECCISPEQHEAAKALRDALTGALKLAHTSTMREADHG